MNFTQAVAEVVDTVKRPDLIGRARREVNAAINFFCLDSEFPQDYAEQSIVLDPQAYTQAFSLTDLTRFRKFQYIKLGGTRKYLKVVSDEEALKGCALSGRYYVAGTAVNVYLPSLSATLDVGYYMYPEMLTDDLASRDHWMLQVSPYMIIERACGALFRHIGDERAMSTCMAAAREYYLAMRKDLLSNQ